MMIDDRLEMPLLINKLNLRGYGVEIGVQNGNYSEIILKKSHLSKLFSIDPWIEFDQEEYEDIANIDQKEQDQAYSNTVKKLSVHGMRSVCLRMLSAEAAGLFTDESLDFVYIDGNHSYEGCSEDITLWWPKLKEGGIFSGHDYLDGEIPAGNFGVKSAVDEFVKEKGLKLFVTDEKWPTWYIIK